MVVGVERLAYRIHGETCGGPDIFVPPNITNEYSNNEAHSAMSGVSVFPADKGFIYDRSKYDKSCLICTTYVSGFPC